MDWGNVAAIFGLVYIIALVYCAIRESATTGLYKALGVYGRLKAYVFVCLLLGGCTCLVIPFVDSSVKRGSVVMLVIIGLACFPVAAWIYISTKRKCPVELQGRLLKSMLISGMGVLAKVMVFILPFIWKLVMPHFTEAVDENGNRLLIAENGDVYTMNGENVGWMKDNHSYIKRY